MKKLNLKKSKIAAIGNSNLLKGGTDNSDVITSITTVTHITNCYISCNGTICCDTTPGTTRPNGSVKTKLGVECLN